MERLSDVSATALLTLFCRAYESRTATPVQRDPEAERIVSKLLPELTRRTDLLSRRLAEDRIDARLAVNLTLRARYYDRCAKAFLEVHPDGVVINLAAGLDTRYHRLGCPEKPFYDLDLPPVISLKRTLTQESTFYHFIASSVLQTRYLSDWSFVDEPEPKLGLFRWMRYLKPLRLIQWSVHYRLG